MWTTFSPFLFYSYIKASVQCIKCSCNDKSFPAIPNMPGSYWTRFVRAPATLQQHTTGVTTATTMAAAGKNGPLAPHTKLYTPRQCIKWMGDNPPSKWVYFFGVLMVCMALNTLWCCGGDALPQHRSVLRTIHTLNTPKHCICMLRGLLFIHLTHQCGAQGLMWGARGPFPPAVAMVGYGCVGRC